MRPLILNFIKHISRKLSNALYFMLSAKNLLSEKALKSLYYSLFHCHVIYAIQIWSCSAESNYKEIVTKQKMAIRIILNASYNAHSELLFKKLNILPIKDLIYFLKIQFMQQFTQGFLPKSFSGEWRTALELELDDEPYDLRNRNYDDLLVPFAR
jgi:hypothetical protein